MISKGLIKRFLPFAVALTLGLFVASFFVTVAAPRFNFNFKRNYSSRKYREVRDLEYKKQRLEEEVRRQQNRIAELEMRQRMDSDSDFDAVNPPPMPIAPARTR